MTRECTTAEHEAWKRDRATFLAMTTRHREREGLTCGDCPRCGSTLFIGEWVDPDEDEQQTSEAA